MILQALLAAASLHAAPATADVTLRFDAELLSTSTGREKIYAKFERAAARSCIDHPRHASTIRQAKICMADLMDQFVDQVGDARLTALHEGEARPAYARR
ncbi:UrcA family protein [Parvularcula dongshanensis]|uniref:UrcA family protein n=1 Tax=Parvularcula dongshanensis TaxID=1173995 RepID=A0A840I1R9_9PROT|nr:UrcA family protein [Parvularcula dongshanensis]MBB4658231.1 UrcA family protein [Parvularcula dongshanensis]